MLRGHFAAPFMTSYWNNSRWRRVKLGLIVKFVSCPFKHLNNPTDFVLLNPVGILYSLNPSLPSLYALFAETPIWLQACMLVFTLLKTTKFRNSGLEVLKTKLLALCTMHKVGINIWISSLWMTILHLKSTWKGLRSWKRIICTHRKLLNGLRIYDGSLPFSDLTCRSALSWKKWPRCEDWQKCLEFLERWGTLLFSINLCDFQFPFPNLMLTVWFMLLLALLFILWMNWSVTFQFSLMVVCRLVGWLIGLSFIFALKCWEITLLCSYQSTCS